MATTTAILNPPKTLSEKIRWARKRAGLSLDRLADKAGTSRQYLIQLEHGRNQPSDAMLKRIADGTGVEPEFFLGAPSERMEADQRERLKSALEPLIDNLAVELVSLVHQAIEESAR